MTLDTFGERLLWARKSYAKITQIELRDKMKEQFGVTIGANYISGLEVERDVKRVSFEKVKAMAGVLHISLDFLAGFTDDPTPAKSHEPTPEYFSEEADQVAKIVDDMRPEQRAILMSLARNLAALPNARQYREDAYMDILSLIERETSKEVRNKIARLMRDKGFPVDPAT